MAQLKRTKPGSIDHHLEMALAAWRGLPEAEREFGKWDWVERTVYVHDLHPRRTGSPAWAARPTQGR